MIKVNEPECCPPVPEKCCPPPCPPPLPIVPYLGVKTINGKEGDVILNKLTFGTKSFNGGTDVTLSANDIGLSGAFCYKGLANKSYIESLIDTKIGDVYLCETDNLYYLNVGIGMWKQFASKEYVDAKSMSGTGLILQDLTTKLSIGGIKANETFLAGTPIEQIIRRLFIPIVTSIAITTPPTKLVYSAGEALDLTGMTITATYSDDSTALITNYTTVPTAGTILTAQDTNIIVSYEGKTCSQPITVRTIDHIRVATPPTKVNYAVGEYFDPTGMVINAVFTNESEEPIPRDDWSYVPETQLTSADNKITINHRGFSCTQIITVN